ncbi:ATP-binding protein [Actinomadura flavalba]|uniref:ATP-binding protein n=1 Tax=Actinomadura flavalba TaxID=1120938 RepID=UPI0003778899|nr:ATP-binding protein [Actinomadura flavalba]
MIRTVTSPNRTGPGIMRLLHNDPHKIADVRCDAEKWAADQGLMSDVIDSVLIIVSELATNALRYAAGPGIFVQLCAVRLPPDDACGVWIEVWDDARDVMPDRQEPDHIAESGRGLFIVDQITGGFWGAYARRDGKGKAVWAGLKIPAT